LNPHEGVTPCLVNVYQFRHYPPVPLDGVEPSTPALSRQCSPAELQGQVNAGQATCERVPLRNVTDFVVGLIVGGIVCGWAGLKMGGARAFMRLGRYEYRERQRRIGEGD
jgi:hypothetical protein